MSLFRTDRECVSRVWQSSRVVRTLARATFLLAAGAISIPVPAAADQNTPRPEDSILEGSVLVSAASSLTDVFSALAQQFEALHPKVRVHLNFAGSAVLATQIERGAPVAVFAAAGRLPIESLVHHDRIDADSVRIFAEGELVLVSKEAGVTLASIAASDRPLAVGNPRLAPVGAYAERSLEAYGLGQSFARRLVLGENVRQVLRYVETGAVAGGLVYRTDVVSSPELLITQSIPPEISGRIEYPIVALRDAPASRVANAFVDFVCGTLARDEFLRQGFLPTCPAAAP